MKSKCVSIFSAAITFLALSRVCHAASILTYNVQFSPDPAQSYGAFQAGSATVTYDANTGVQTIEGQISFEHITSEFFAFDPATLAISGIEDVGNFDSLSILPNFTYNLGGHGQLNIGTYTVTSTSATTPEPASFALLTTGLLSAAGIIRKRRINNAA